MRYKSRMYTLRNSRLKCRILAVLVLHNVQKKRVHAFKNAVYHKINLTRCVQKLDTPGVNKTQNITMKTTIKNLFKRYRIQIDKDNSYFIQYKIYDPVYLCINFLPWQWKYVTSITNCSSSPLERVRFSRIKDAEDYLKKCKEEDFLEKNYPKTIKYY